MNPRDFLVLAEEWVVELREAEWRSAVSRAYYAVFHVARELFQRCGFVVSQGDQAHRYLWIRLANSGHPTIQRAGNDLNFLRRRRNWADYEFGSALSQHDAMNDVAAAADVIRTLDSLLTLPHILAQITASMRNYERNVLGDETWRP